MINQQQQQQNEDMYGNEVKRRRMDATGHHLKVWAVCEVKYGVDDEAKGDEVLPGTEVLRMIQEEEEEEEPVAHEEEEEDHQVHQVQEPVHLIGRKIRVQTTTQGVFRDACVGPFEFRGTLVGLFELNGERAIHIVTTNGENHMFTTSQIMTLQMFHPEEDEETEELSPIPHCDQDQVQDEVDQDEVDQNEVIQIEDDEVDQNEVIQVIQIDQNEVIQIDDDDEEQVQEEPEEPACCAICLDATDAARNFVSLCCGHQFHFACIMGNMANGGYNRNQCPMCRSAVVQEYHIANEHEEIQQVMQRNQQLAHELERTREYRGQIAAEYMHVVNMNLQIRMRYDEEQEARDALHRRGYAFGLNERIAAIVANAANNDIRQNYENGAAVHVERQILDLCMSFGMTAYDRQYDQNPIQYEDEMAE
jgi:hypothetical protein